MSSHFIENDLTLLTSLSPSWFNYDLQNGKTYQFPAILSQTVGSTSRFREHWLLENCMLKVKKQILSSAVRPVVKTNTGTEGIRCIIFSSLKAAVAPTACAQDPVLTIMGPTSCLPHNARKFKSDHIMVDRSCFSFPQYVYVFHRRRLSLAYCVWNRPVIQAWGRQWGKPSLWWATMHLLKAGEYASCP